MSFQARFGRFLTYLSTIKAIIVDIKITTTIKATYIKGIPDSATVVCVGVVVGVTIGLDVGTEIVDVVVGVAKEVIVEFGVSVVVDADVGLGVFVLAI